MAGTKRPSFLKRQKEQKRLARAAEKRDAKRMKKQGKTLGNDSGGPEDDGLEMGDALEVGEVQDADVDVDVDADPIPEDKT